jgi:predicted NBD/HSP70 family sugar kinase
MTAKQQQPRPTKQQNEGEQPVNAMIGTQVLGALGQPGDLHGVQVRQLWEDHYRVNILVGDDAASLRIAHSYFLVADGDGNILASTPGITRQY